MFAGGDSDRLVHVAPLPDVYRVTPADQVESPHDGGVTAAVERHLRVTRQMLNMARVGGRKVRNGGLPRTTVSQDLQTRFSMQLAFAKFLSKIKNFLIQCQYHGYSTPTEFSLYFR